MESLGFMEVDEATLTGQTWPSLLLHFAPESMCLEDDSVLSQDVRYTCNAGLARSLSFRNTTTPMVRWVCGIA